MAAVVRHDPNLRDYARGIWRRKLIVAAVIVLFTSAALAYSFVKTPLYEASAELIYESQLNVADPLSNGTIDPTTQQLEVGNAASVIESPALIKSANAALDSNQTAQVIDVTAAPTAESGQDIGSTVSVSAVSTDAVTAAAAANAYADAFVDSRKELEQDKVRQAMQVIQARIDSFGTSGHGTAEYLTLQQRLQDLQILEATATGNFRLLIPATTPTSPFSPDPVRNGIMGFMAGLFFGVAIALLIEQFDTRVRAVDELVALFGVPLLARIRKLPAQEAKRQTPVLLTDPRGVTAEAIRKLRSNLEFTNLDGDVKSLFITSCLQHEGKSLTVCNLALALAATGNRVVLVDGDLRRPQVHRYMSLPNSTGLSMVLSGKAKLDDVLLSRSLGPGLTTAATRFSSADSERDNQLAVLTSGPLPPNPAEVIASGSFARLITALEERFDLVIVDAPALLAVGDTAAMARCVDGLVFLVDLSRARRHLLQEAAAQLDQMPCRKLGLVVLSAGAHRRSERYYYSYEATDSTSAEAAKPLLAATEKRGESPSGVVSVSPVTRVTPRS